MFARYPPWSGLPLELLFVIANFLTSNPIWVITFRSVCSSWRSSFPRLPHPSLLSPRLPLTVRLSPFSYHGSPSILSVTVIYALCRPLELSETWILFVDEFTPGNLRLRKPFSKTPYNLPINFPRSINLLDYNVHELGRFYNFSSTCVFGYSKRVYPIDTERFCSENFQKVILCPCGLAVIALFDGKLRLVRLVIGVNDIVQSCICKWEILHDGKGFRFDDIVEYKGRVLGVERRGRVYEIDYNSFEMNPVVPPITGGGGWRKRLVESLGSLYLVVKCNVDPSKTDGSTSGVKGHVISNERSQTKFKVYELNEETNKWCEISSLGDRSFFFGLNFSFSASAHELGTCGKNCILFRKRSFPSYKGKNDYYWMYGKFKGIDLSYGVCHLNDPIHSDLIGSYPGYSDILWPPPAWIWPIERVERLIVVDEILTRIPENIRPYTKMISI